MNNEILLKFCTECGHEVEPYLPSQIDLNDEYYGRVYMPKWEEVRDEPHYWCSYCRRWNLATNLYATGIACQRCGILMPFGNKFCGLCGASMSSPFKTYQQVCECNDLGNGLIIGGVYRHTNLAVISSDWTSYEPDGFVKSGWLYMPVRTFAHAEAFFKVHIFDKGRGYIHILDAANPPHQIWLETATGFRREDSFCWSEKPELPKTVLWEFNWK